MSRRVLFFLSMILALGLVPIFQNSAKGDSEFVGSEVCKGCHEKYYNDFMKFVHGKREVPGNPVNSGGCEACHGPGSQHVERGGGRGVAIFAFNKKMDPNDRSSVCLSCHSERRDLPFWDLSKHKTMQVACNDCHSIHSSVSRKNYLKAQEPILCFGCHRSIRAQFNKQSHHPVKEEFVGRQALRCSSCHNVMGTPDVKAMLKADSVNELCFKCHAEKRGPFAFEHPPVAENCLNCHEPHGSNHNTLLTRKAPLLCESCHDTVGGRHPTDPYTNLSSFLGPATSGKNKFFARACLNCHGNIHGSSLNQFFVR